MDNNNQSNMYDNMYGYSNGNMNDDGQKIKNKSSFYKGLATGVTVTLVVLILVFVGNYLLTKNYIETDDREQMLENGGFDILGNPISGEENLSDEMLQIMYKAQYIQDIIEMYYYYDEDMEALTEGMYEGMYEGMLASLGDPYSVYYDEEAFAAMMESTTGTYCGIGVVVQQDVETMTITVVNPYEDCPAYEAGMRPGDIILGADDIDFTGLDINEAVSYIKGEEGTTVTIHILRGEDKMDLVVERRMIDIHTVSYELLEGNIAHIIIESFDDVTYDQFTSAMEQAKNDSCVGYIFDVRNNGGGLYDTVVDMLDDLLPEGKIVYTEDKYGNQDTEMSDEECLEAPMAVLINGYSASASEVFAGAIQDYGVGKIIGTTSFGKGIVQSIMPLGDGTAVKVTISSYFTPNGRDIHGVGITPDIEIDLPNIDDIEGLENVEDAYDGIYLKYEYDTQLQEAVKYIRSCAE